ncbi:DUF4296 domain-containing protein [Fulvitalea axinellae]|uniref:DUF4296 domain-containing protein n=1 Tax=Fulvitalea axinellae TaxID=1182444 RepID=UPI0030CA2B7E
MKKTLLTYLLALVAFSSCQTGGKKPKGLLPPEKMVPVLADIYLYEAKVYYMNLSRDSAKNLFATIKPGIFARDGVDSTAFNASISYYTEHPKEFSKIYKQLFDTIQSRKATWEAEEQRKKAFKDSVDQAREAEEQLKANADSLRLQQLDSLPLDSLAIDTLSAKIQLPDSLKKGNKPADSLLIEDKGRK